MLDLALLRAFVAVAETSSFTRAAGRLGVTQSTVSQQIRKLETGLGRSLLVRNTHAVRLSPAGTILLAHARIILAAVGEAELQLQAPDMLGEVRLGIAEDFASSRLPDILRQFRHAHAQVTLRIEIDMSRTLLASLDRGDLDLALVKCGDEDRRPERRILLEPLIWVGTEERPALARERPLPLALHPEPSITRTILLERLAAAGIPVAVTHVGNTLSGLGAGVAAGIGISAFGRNFIPSGLCILDREALGLPELPALAFILARSPHGLDPAARILADLIEKSTVALEIGRPA